MNAFKMQITSITATSAIIKPDMIEIEIDKNFIEKAEKIIKSMTHNGADQSTIYGALLFNFYQAVEHLEPNDIADLAVKTGDDGKHYVLRDMNYTVLDANVVIERDGSIYVDFPIEQTNDKIIIHLGTVDSLLALGTAEVVKEISVKVAVLCFNSNNKRELLAFDINSTEADVRDGRHIYAAQSLAAKRGYFAPMEAFDSSDPAMNQLVHLTQWSSS